MYETILLPTDGSEGMTETLSHGLALADRYGATLHTIYVVDRRLFLGAPDEAREQIEQSLTEEGDRAVGLVEKQAGNEGISVVSSVQQGIPYKEILEYADEADIDLIVMGTHGRTGRDRLVTLGSVTERVVANASVPVLVVNIGDGE